MPSINETVPVLADVGNAVYLIIVIVGGFITWIAKVSKEDEQKRRAAGGGRGGGPRDERLRTEIDAFLQEVAAAKQGPRDVVAEFEQPPPARQQPPRQQPARQERPRPQQRQPRRPAVGAKKRKPPRTSKLGSGVGRYVAEHMHPGEFAERVEIDVPDSIAQSVAKHLGKFSSEGEAPVPATGASLLAREMVEMLRNPSGVRQAIVVNEVLSRPKSLRKG
jgi:hypothetical protein